ncbi:hypothetical protein HGRIS_006265 [Hohenbuehelia grisea]|uniref:Uncharacterized protein n=1 Tax=Hohenbuehelia grisea TaxID=104357 RepID=A0ABR3JZT9_9AGAR
MSHAVTLAQKLSEGAVHYGKEISVIAMCSFGTKLRGALPIVISSTCKQETPEESGALLLRVIEAWKKGGQHSFGPIWSFASDGDAGRRAMVYQLFTKRFVGPTHPLYKYVGSLSGLNLMVGDGDITGDFDWKHEIKRLARLIRTFEGVVIGKTIINHETLRKHLSRSHAIDAVDRLLKPEDSQDVPRAIEFLEAVRDVCDLATDDLTPTELQELPALSLLARLIDTFLRPFIDVTLCLTQQIISLSTFAHLSFALFRLHRVSFMPSQLYGDIQTTIKNVIFCVAKQQEMDPSQPFPLVWTGDDRLEVLFGYARMQGGHNPNFNFKEFIDRLGSAIDLGAVFARNPDMAQPHRRLRVTRVEKADHLNPESWLGSICAESVDLDAAWKAGCSAASVALAASRVPLDFAVVFDPDRITNMLQPFGDGKYPGVSAEGDRSLDSEVEAGEPQPRASSTDDSTTLLYSSLDPSGEHEFSPADLDGSGSDAEEFVETDELTLDDHLDMYDTDTDFSSNPPSAQTTSHVVSPWIQHDGGKIHKTTVCRLIITPNYIRKSQERIPGIRSFSAQGKPRNFNTDDVIAPDSFVVGDLFATLLRCNSSIVLSINKSIAIEEKGTRVDVVRGVDMPHFGTGIKLTGQVLDMRMVHRDRADDETAEPAEKRFYSWLWNGSFAKIEAPTKTRSGAEPMIGKALTRKTLCIKVPSALCEALNATAAPVQGRMSRDACPELNTADLTWELMDTELYIVLAKLWETTKKSRCVKMLPRCEKGPDFP